MYVYQEHEQVRFFGALTLQLVLAREPGPPTIALPVIQQTLLSRAVVETAQFVRTKLGVAIAALAFKAIPAGSWQSPITSLASSLLNSSEKPESQLSATKSLLSLYTVFAQEFGTHTFAHPSSRILVFESLRRDASTVLNLIGSVLQYDLDSYTGSLLEQDLAVKCKMEALGCVLAWGAVDKVIPVEFMPTLLSLVISHLQYRQTFHLACQVLAELLTFKDLLVHEKTVCDGLLPVLTQGIVYNEFQRCLEEQDAYTAHALCTLLSQVGESFPKYIVKKMGGESLVLRLLEMILRLTAFPGFYGVDEDVSHIPDEFWFELEESLTDDTVLPTLSTLQQQQQNASHYEITTDPVTREPVLHGDGVRVDGTRIVTRFLNRSAQGGWDLSGFPEGVVERVWAVAREVFGALVGVVRQKMERPKEAEFNTWNQDMRDKFRMYRIDKGETLLACNQILGKSIYDILVPLGVQQVEEIGQGRGEDGQTLESTLYSIKSIAENVHVNDCPPLHIVFGDGIMGRISLMPPQFWRVRLTFCLLIGEARHPSWLSKNPAYLLPVITFLMNSLTGNAALTSAAVSSLEHVCSVCRKQLGGVAKDMMVAWERMKGDLSSNDRIRLIRSVSTILEPLPLQEQLPLVMSLTGSMISEMRTTLAVLAATPKLLSQPPEVEVAERMLVRDLLRLLKGVCQGIQAVEVVFDDEDESNDQLSAVAGAKAMNNVVDIKTIDPTLKANMAQLSAVVWETVGAVFQVFVQDEETIDIASGLITIALGSSIPIMFTPNPSSLSSLLIQSFRTNHFPIQLRVMSILIQSIKTGAPNNPDDILAIGDRAVVREWVTVRLIEVNAAAFPILLGPIASADTSFMAEKSDVVEAYFKFLARALAKHPWSLIQLPKEHQEVIYGRLVLAGLALQERASCTAVFDFVRDLVSFKADSGVAGAGAKRSVATRTMKAESQDSLEAQQCRDLLHEAVRLIGLPVVRTLLLDVGSGLPTSMWPLIADLLHRIITHFPNEARAWVMESLQADGFPTSHCSNQDKEEFVKGMMVAQMKAFKDLVKKFGLKCRNLQDTTYGSAIRV
ncbi:armadillo-type protein [Chytriomyces sp. MP71]|nr:armadillo-type protein [Chytriomyces sp. MP71]